MTTYQRDSERLKTLARRLLEHVHTEENAEKRRRWAQHNDLLKKDKPLLWVCPDDDGGWAELIPEETLVCQDAELRQAEIRLLRYLYQAEHFHDDFVFEPCLYFNIPGEYTGYLYGNADQKTAWGIDIVKPKVGRQAYHLDAFIKDEGGFEPLLNHEVDFVEDTKELHRLKEKFDDALGGIVEAKFQLPYSVLVQAHLIELVHLRGLENLMYDLYDIPDLLMDVIGHMAQSKARLITKLEREHRLFENRINIYTGSGSLGYTTAPTKPDGEITLKDMWGFADAQEFSNVSSEMFERFALQNQKIGLNLFGMGCYGCCEPLDDKYEAVFRHITNLRRLSVSPWTNIELAAEKIGGRAIYSWKPNPALITTGFEDDEILALLKRVKAATKDCFLEIILKDIRTVAHTNRHLVRFIELVSSVFQ